MEEEVPRFIRQRNLVDQNLLSELTVCVAGLGGLGSVVAYYLTALGVGRLVIVDKDKVEWSNLNRQILYTEKDIGKLKAKVACKRLRELNSSIEIIDINDNVRNLENYDVCHECDFIFDCLDNWKDKLFLDELSHRLNAVLIHGGVKEFEGQIYIHIPGKNKCLNEIFRVKNFKKESFQVVGPTCGIIGSLMVQLFLLYLKGFDVWKYIYFYRYYSLERVKL